MHENEDGIAVDDQCRRPKRQEINLPEHGSDARDGENRLPTYPIR